MRAHGCTPLDHSTYPILVSMWDLSVVLEMIEAALFEPLEFIFLCTLSVKLSFQSIGRPFQ